MDLVCECICVVLSKWDAFCCLHHTSGQSVVCPFWTVCIPVPLIFILKSGYDNIFFYHKAFITTKSKFLYQGINLAESVDVLAWSFTARLQLSVTMCFNLVYHSTWDEDNTMMMKMSNLCIKIIFIFYNINIYILVLKWFKTDSVQTDFSSIKLSSQYGFYRIVLKSKFLIWI